MRGKDPVETIMDLVLEDRSRIGTIYFLMSEDNIKKQIRQPWVSFGSDAASIAPEGNVSEIYRRIRELMEILRGCWANMCAKKK